MIILSYKAESPEKLNKMEFVKLEKDGFDVIGDICRYAETGYDSKASCNLRVA